MPSISECPCGRSFLRTRDCGEHCTPKCCRDSACLYATPARGPKAPRTPENQDLPEPEKERKCSVCGCPRRYFQPFAPCSDDCQGGMFFQSSRSDPGTVGPATFAQTFIRACHLFPEMEAQLHRPRSAPRIHARYCSLRCYNSLAYGHETRVRTGNKVRNARWRAKYLTQTPFSAGLPSLKADQ